MARVKKMTAKVLQTELLKIAVTKEKKYKTSMDIRSEPLSCFEGEPEIHATITADGCIIAHKFSKIMVRADEITFEEIIAEDGTKYLYICKKEE